MDFQIEKNIEIPSVYPFRNMEKGDSFFVPIESDNKADMNKLRSAIISAGSAKQYKNEGKKFTVRKMDGGFRCWRVL